MKMPKVIPSDGNIDFSIKNKDIGELVPRQFGFTEVSDSKAFNKFIKEIEKFVRGSVEYRGYIGYLKEELDITTCTFLPNVDISEIKGVGIEFHHYPFTLYDICSTVVMKRANMGEHCLSAFVIADEVMKLHYENKVGLVPLSQTVHELAHSGEVFISIDKVFGDIKSFVQEYKNGIEDELKTQLKHLITLSKKTAEDYRPEVLEKKATYLEMDNIDNVVKRKVRKIKLA